MNVNLYLVLPEAATDRLDAVSQPELGLSVLLTPEVMTAVIGGGMPVVRSTR